MSRSLRALRSTFTGALATLLVVGSGALWVPAATADTAPVTPGVPKTVAADGLPTVQVDGVVWHTAVSGDRVFAGGRFTTARPAGAAPGSSTTPRSNLLSFNLTTGALNTAFVANTNGQVLAVAPSPDGSRLYLAGEFTSVNGVARNRIAAVDATSGAVVSSFAPSLNFRASTLVVSGTTVHVGGAFSVANNATRNRLAAFSTTNGALLPWAPSADRNVLAMVSAAGKIVIGGSFENVNGAPAYGMAALDPVSGASRPWAATEIVRNAGPDSAINSLSTDGTNVYGTGYAYLINGGNAGNFEGTFAADPDTGRIRWIQDCRGDHYGVWSNGTVAYTAGHGHDCANLPGPPETNPRSYTYALAFTAAATGTLLDGRRGSYADFGGQPAASLLTWYPTLDAGTFTGQSQAAWNVTGSADYVVMAGEFPRVNNVPQQGLVRFAVDSKAPNKRGPRVSGAAFNPTIAPLSDGSLRLAWQANHDQDNETLTYKVLRDGAVIATSTQASTFWRRPAMGYKDKAVVPGQAYRYRITAQDAFGNLATSETVTVTAGAAAASAYRDAVLADGPTSLWRLGEPSGTIGVDSAGFDDLTLGSGIARGQAGAVGGSDTASTFDGTPAGTAANRASATAPNTFTVETWVKTTSTSGGKLLGFGNAATGDSSSYDRHLYLDSTGRLSFGVYTGDTVVLRSAAALNDGAWHHVVGSMSSSGMALYVDGKKVGSNGTTAGQSFTGFWRVGGDNLNGWPNQPASSNLEGTLDEVAVYPNALSLEQVQQHYAASGRTIPTAPKPTDAYGAAVFGAGPDSWWRLSENGGPVARDASPNSVDQAYDGVYAGGVTFGSAGAVTGGGTAVTLDGVDGVVAASQPVNNPRTYSTELWFRTTTSRGGKLIGFGTAQTGSSGGYDRHVYMLDSGQLLFGTYTGVLNTITTTGAFNDGAWHHMVATQGGDGMALYVDGALTGTNAQTGAQEYTGYWRVGGDNTWGGASSNYFAGTIDEAAVYGKALSASDVAGHYAAGTGTAPANAAPTASFTSSSTGLVASFDASASADADGTVASYAWDFGDGSTGTGRTTSRTYAAAGSYTVRLTVTDDDGATGTTTRTVAVAAANAAPTASFTSSSTGLVASFDATASADLDGTVASYAWDFGDGSTGTGRTTSRTYAAAGSYTVGLTVTDDDGATGTTTRSVTVTGPATPTSYATDAFGRTVTGGFGTADTGGAWSTVGRAADLSVGGGAGRLRLPTAGAQNAAYLNAVSSSDTEVAVAMSVDKPATGGGVYVSVVGRRIAADSYRTQVRMLSTGQVTVGLVRTSGGVETSLGTVPLPGTLTAGQVLQVRLQVSGTGTTVLRAKAWASGTAEPAAWTVSATDTTAALQTTGSAGVIGYLSGSATNAPVVVSFDDLQVGPTR